MRALAFFGGACSVGVFVAVAFGAPPSPSAPSAGSDAGTDARSPHACTAEFRGALQANADECFAFQHFEMGDAGALSMADAAAGVLLSGEPRRGSVAGYNVVVRLAEAPRVGPVGRDKFALFVRVIDRAADPWFVLKKPPPGASLTIDSVRRVGDGRYEIHGTVDTAAKSTYPFRPDVSVHVSF